MGGYWGNMIRIVLFLLIRRTVVSSIPRVSVFYDYLWPHSLSVVAIPSSVSFCPTFLRHTFSSDLFCCHCLVVNYVLAQTTTIHIATLHAKTFKPSPTISQHSRDRNPIGWINSTVYRSPNLDRFENVTLQCLDLLIRRTATLPPF
jgi:hypothetical protein